MGAGASTEFNAEAVLSDEGDPTEPVADEGYDSDLAGDVRSLADHRPARDPAKPEVDNVRGRLSMYPEVGGKASKLPCAEHIKKPELYPHDAPHNALELPDDTLKLEFVHGYRAHDVRGNFPAPRTAAATEPTSSLRKARTGNPPKPLPSVQRKPETRVTFVFDSNPIVPLTPRFDHSRSTVDLSVPAVTSPALRHGCRSLHRVQRRGGSFG